MAGPSSPEKPRSPVPAVRAYLGYLNILSCFDSLYKSVPPESDGADDNIGGFKCFDGRSFKHLRKTLHLPDFIKNDDSPFLRADTGDSDIFNILYADTIPPDA